MISYKQHGKLKKTTNMFMKMG